MDQLRTLTRRHFLRSVGALAAATALGAGLDLRQARPAVAQGLRGRAASLEQGLNHLAWVWQFLEDGPPEAIRSVLAQHNLGVVLKTHDGIGWMSEYDGSPDAVSGPQQVARLAAFFEEAGVPFHAWCVVKGLEPAKEAAMCAEVLAAGARSITVDLEPYAGFWQATPREAMVFGDTLRRLQPAAWVVVSVDPRPWQMDRIPLKEFSSFSDEFAPQIYWDQLSSPENHQAFARNGITPGPEGITPRSLLDAAMGGLRQYGLPIQPIGQGSTDKPGAWKEFLDHAFTLEAEAVSVWRFGVTLPEVWPLLKENPPRPLTYIVQPGDTLSALAVEWHTAVPAIAEVNGISNPNLIYVGQELIVPRGSRSRPSSPSSPSSSQPPPKPPYTVQAGDTLSGLAERWNTTVDRIIEINDIPNPDLIQIGTQLRIP